MPVGCIRKPCHPLPDGSPVLGLQNCNSEQAAAVYTAAASDIKKEILVKMLLTCYRKRVDL
jgi:hypothetical protein